MQTRRRRADWVTKGQWRALRLRLLPNSQSDTLPGNTKRFVSGDVKTCVQYIIRASIEISGIVFECVITLSKEALLLHVEMLWQFLNHVSSERYTLGINSEVATISTIIKKIVRH